MTFRLYIYTFTAEAVSIRCCITIQFIEYCRIVGVRVRVRARERAAVQEFRVHEPSLQSQVDVQQVRR